MAASGGATSVDSTISQVKRLTNANLKVVCKYANLPVSGAKAALQSRVIDHLRYVASLGNQDGLRTLKSVINQPHTSYDPSRNALPPNNTLATIQNQIGPRSHYHASSTLSQNFYGSGGNRPSNGVGTRGPLFKESPFFKILEPLTPLIECQVREENRDTVHASVSLPPGTADNLAADRTLRVMIYCTADPGSLPATRVDISFPHQVEIKVNQDEVKGNLRGLKNKPGTTRPADITDLLRKKNHYKNDVAITYALTKIRYYLVVNLVQQIAVESLVSKLKSNKTIKRDSVISEMLTKAGDTDVVATSTILSLKCPLSTLRIQVPCRSSVCNHNQCFDAASFLQLQEQAPTWTCPICNKTVSFDILHVDDYVDDILTKTPKSAEQVTIEPTGEWSVRSESNTSRATGTSDTSEDESRTEVLEIRSSPNQAAPLKTHSSQTTIGPKHLFSQSDGPRTNGSHKRPAPQVVDLTLSSDEEVPLVRPKKRINTSIMANGTTKESASVDLPSRSSLPSGPSNHPSVSFLAATSSYHRPR